MTTFFIKAIQLILSLSILVIVHEYGHYLFSRLFNIRVEKFYMFFNPSFSLVRAKKINGKYRFKFFAKNTSDLVHENSDKEVNNSSDLDETSDTHLSDEEWNKHADTTEWGVGWEIGRAHV